MITKETPKTITIATQCMAALEELVQQALQRDEPKEMREVAVQLALIEQYVSKRLGAMQGKLNSKAFGR